MGKALLGATSPGTSAMTTARFVNTANANLQQSQATEATVQAVCRVAGTFSKFAMNIDATGTSRTYRFRVNAANGNQVINPTDTTAGVYSDNSNTDTLAAGDKFDFSTSSTGTPNAYWVRSVFEATSGHACYYQKRTAAFATDSASAFVGLCGESMTPTATEANVQCKARVAGTLRYLQCYISGNSRSTSSTYKTRINGADGSSSITVTAGATGLFEDTSNTDTIASGDLVNFGITNGASGGTITAFFVGAWILSSSTSNDLFSSAGGTTRAASGTATYFPFTGTTTSSATEANASIQHGFDARASKLRIYLSVNSYTTDGTATFRVAAADGNQTITLTAGATGWFEDTTHTDDFTANQDCCVKIVGGTSGSITIRTIGLTEGPSTTAYTQSAQASTSPAASLTRQTGKPLQATTTPTTSLTALRVVLSSIQGLAAQATSLTRQTGAVRQATTTPTKAIAHAIAAARQATSSPVALRTSQTTKTGQTTTTPPATTTKATEKPASGLSALVASTIRATGKPAQATASRAASLSRSTGKGAQGSTTPAKSLSRLTAAVRQASTAPTGRFTAALTKALQAVASVIATNPISYALTLRVSASLTASLTKLRVFIGRSAEQVINAVGQSASAVISGWIGKTSSSSTTFTGKSADE